MRDLLDYTYKAEPAPTGSDEMVLPLAVHHMIDIVDPTNHWIVYALEKRALIGREKYGDYLRINNGRNPLVDYLQEQLDAVMYACQAYTEAPSHFTWKLIELATEAAIMARRQIEKQRFKPEFWTPMNTSE